MDDRPATLVVKFEGEQILAASWTVDGFTRRSYRPAGGKAHCGDTIAFRHEAAYPTNGSKMRAGMCVYPSKVAQGPAGFTLLYAPVPRGKPMPEDR